MTKIRVRDSAGFSFKALGGISVLTEFQFPFFPLRGMSKLSLDILRRCKATLFSCKPVHFRSHHGSKNRGQENNIFYKMATSPRRNLKGEENMMERIIGTCASHHFAKFNDGFLKDDQLGNRWGNFRGFRLSKQTGVEPISKQRQDSKRAETHGCKTRKKNNLSEKIITAVVLGVCSLPCCLVVVCNWQT